MPAARQCLHLRGGNFGPNIGVERPNQGWEPSNVVMSRVRAMRGPGQYPGLTRFAACLVAYVDYRLIALNFKCLCAFRSQSTDTPANSTTLRHFSVSSAISLPNSGGVIGIGWPPSSASLAASL